MDGQFPWEALLHDVGDFADLGRMTHVAVRLSAAAVLGGILGFEREAAGKAAGVRTYMLVAVGAAFFIVVPQFEGADTAAMSRVLQGIIPGIGFLGGGAILKLASDKQILGLTTAAGIWQAAAVGVAAGFGRLGTACLATALAFVILTVVRRWEERFLKHGTDA
jgi:putative Mg2+ transporter-C (MgtC) family protein